MNSSAIVVVSVLLSAAAGAGVSLALRAPAETAPVDATGVADRLRALEQWQRDAQGKLDARVPSPVSASSPVERTAATLSPEQIGAAVEAYLAQRGNAVPAVAGGAGSAAGEFDIATRFPELQGTSYWDNPDLWKKAFAAGRMEELIGKFEEIAKASPNDVKAQMNLAKAYMAYMHLDQTKWEYSMKADGVYDTVLKLDETHWEARFSKAVSYTFWPDFLGKKNEAISHFETLVSQQESQPVQAHHAQTYLYLGNLLEQRDAKKAREIWAKGARRHPESQELAKKLGG